MKKVVLNMSDSQSTRFVYEVLPSESSDWVWIDPELQQQMLEGYKNEPDVINEKIRYDFPASEFDLVWEKPDDAYYKRTYGLQHGKYSEMYEAQDGRCAICGCPPDEGKLLVVDHDYWIEEVRGLLCGRCNTALVLRLLQ